MIKKKFLMKYKPWGVILFLRNIKTIKQTKNQWAANEIFNLGRQYEQDTTELKSPLATQFLSSLSSQSFTPTISIYSATYSVTYNLYFGLFVELPPTT